MNEEQEQRLETILDDMSEDRLIAVARAERRLQEALIACAKTLTREELSLATSSVLQSTLQALNRGVCIVPRYPTQEMLDHAYAMDAVDADKCERAYRAMVEVGREYAIQPISERK